MKLYSYYRSTAAYRVRIALNYKGLAFEAIPVNLRTGQQHEKDYRKHNHQGRVPTLIDGDLEIGQSMAILEYLEESFPNPALLPKEIKTKAMIRYFSQIIVSDIHPLNNLGVLNYLTEHCGQNQQQVKAWYHHWLKQGFDALEMILSQQSHTEHFCFGSTPTFADICLIPQVYNAQRFEFAMTDYPLIMRINEYCLTQPYFDKAKPENQPDFAV